MFVKTCHAWMIKRGVGGMLWCANAMRCGARGSCSGDRAVCVCKAFGVDDGGG